MEGYDAAFAAGTNPPSYDKQFVRDWLETVKVDGHPWDKTPPAPRLPREVIEKTAAKYREALERVGRPVVVHEPTSHAALRFVERLRKDGLVAEILPTPTFALPRVEFEEWAGDRETFRMEDFYRSQRRRFDVLMEGGEPVGMSALRFVYRDSRSCSAE